MFLALSVSCFGQKNTNKGTIKVKLDTTIFAFSDVMPAFIGGNDSLNRFIELNIRYPRSAVERGAGGTSIAAFVVNKDGSISNISISKNANNCIECDSAALFVIYMMPKWSTGKNKGEPVRVQCNLPFKFRVK